MIFDMHCHTSEGSPDAVVSVNDTIRKLKYKGYNGMLVSDHNSYKGYKSVVNKFDDFIVLRGIEYDFKFIKGFYNSTRIIMVLQC